MNFFFGKTAVINKRSFINLSFHERENNHFISSDIKGISSASLHKCLNIDGLVARCETASCLTLAKEQLASGVVSNKSRSLYIVEHTRTYNKIFSYMSMGPAPTRD